MKKRRKTTILTCTRAASAITAAPVCTISAARTGTGLLRFLKASNKARKAERL